MNDNLSELIKKRSEEIKEDLVRFRRYFHENPELGFEEHGTAKYITNLLDEWGVSYKSGIAKTGIVATIKGHHPGKTILIRADMDALPLKEMNDVPYKSKIEGKMHACGHDAHVAILLGTIKIINEFKERLNGTIHFVFQPAEEGPGGAKPMVESGVFGDPDNMNIDMALALHVETFDQVGEISLKAGEMTASSDEIHFIIQGRGGHGAAPHETIDPVFIAAHVLTGIYSWLTRHVDPLEPVVFTIGRLCGGTRFNIIPDKAEIDATLRTLNHELREKLLEEIPKVARTIAEAFDGQLTVRIERGYPVGINAPRFTDLVIQAASEIIGKENVKSQERPIMGSEDFYEFGRNKIPSVLFWLGAGNKEKGINKPNHSAQFDIDENALPIGAAILSLVALKYKDLL